MSNYNSCSTAIAPPNKLRSRATIIMLADAGHNHREIARQLKISRKMARLWRERWIERQATGMAVAERLQDAERSGAPATFELEQVLHLFNPHSALSTGTVDNFRQVEVWKVE